MRGAKLVSCLLVTVLLSGNLVVGAGDAPGGAAAPDRPERTMAFNFDWSVSKVSFLGSEWDAFTIDGCQPAYGAGGPDIPVKVVRLELPGPIDKLDVRFGGKSTLESVRLAPVGPAYLQGLDLLDTSRPLVDNALYSKDRLLPAADHQLFKLGQYRSDDGSQVWVYEVHLFPLRYNPARGTAILKNDCELGVHYKAAPAPAPRAPGDATPYVIITSTAVNASGALSSLVAWKTKKGLPAKVFEVSWIAANYPGYDTPEKIRNFLMERYSSPYVMQWLLIVGDNDTVPSRLVKDPSPVAPYDDGWIPADGYYACLDTTTNWDTYNSNHVYGEFFDTNFDGLYEATDLDDAIQDVWVGRFSSSDTARISVWANNTVAYEKATSAAWMNSCLLIAPNAGTMGTAMNTAAKMEEYINKTVQGYYGYLGGYYGKVVSSGVIRRLYEASGTLSRAAIISAINSGVAFGTWIAPGDATSISSSTLGTLFSSPDVASLANGAQKPVLFGMSSSAGRFDDQECLGEALTENNLANGAMGFVGASRVTTGMTSLGYPSGGLGNGTAIQMDFLYQMQLGRQFDSSLLYMGKTLGYAKRGYRDVQRDATLQIFIHDYTIKAFYEYNLLGEPNSPVWTDVGSNFNPTTRVAEDANFKNVSIWVRSTLNVPCNHTLVCLEYGSANYYASAETSIDGYANFTIPKAMGFGNVTITRADFTPFEYSEMPLDDTYAPYTLAVQTPLLADGKDNWFKTAPTVRLFPEQGVTTYYHWDGGADQIYTGEVFTAPEGLHTLYFHSVDWKNNKEGEQSLTFKVDSQVPKTALTVSPEFPDGQNGWYVQQPTVTLSLPGDTGSPVTRKYKLDADTLFYTYADAIPIEDGQHTVYYFSEDDAGNKENQRSLIIKVDTQAPSSVATVTPLKPDGLAGWYVKEPTVNFFADDTLTVPHVRYSWDGGEPANTTATGSVKPAQGIHNLSYQAVDEAGNAEEPKNLTFKLDSLVPSTNITTDPSAPDGMNGWFVTRPTISFDTGGPAVVQYKWNNEPLACATGPLLAPEGQNLLTYYGVDEAGNKEGVRLAGFKVDTSVPVTNITVSPADRGDQWYTKRPKVKLSNAENSSISYYFGTEIDNVQKYTKEFEVPEGRNILHFWSMDEAGNKEAERTKGFDVDSVAPSVSFTPSVMSIDAGGSVSFELKGTDSNGVTEFFLDFGDGNNTGWMQNLAVSHSYASAGNYTVLCQGRDPAGNVGNAAAKTIEVKGKYVPPVVNPPDEEPGMNWMLIGGVIAVIAVVAIAVGVAMSRRKPKDDFFIKEQREKEKLKETMPAYDFASGRTEPASIAETAAYAGTAGTAAAAEAPAAPAQDSRFFNCPKCGNEVEKGAEYCYTCGERFKKGGAGGAPPPEAPARPAYEPRQPEPPAYAPAQPAGEQYQAPAEQYYDAGQARPAYEAPVQPVYEAPAQPAYEAPAPPARPAARPPAQAGDLDNIMSRLESLSHPAPAGAPAHAAPAAAHAAPARQPLPPPPPRTQHPAPGTPHPAPPQASEARLGKEDRRSSGGAPHPAAPAASASAQAGTGKACPKCGSEMVRLVDLPGAQGEQLKKLNARGQHAFQCRKCNHFEISAWNPGT